MPTVQITADTEADLDERIAAYKRSYHPSGYGTTVISKKQVRPDWWAAIVWRAASCD